MLCEVVSHLNIFDVGKWDADADDGPRVVVGKVEAFGNLPAADGDEKRAVDGAVADGAVGRRLNHLQCDHIKLYVEMKSQSGTARFPSTLSSLRLVEIMLSTLSHTDF